MISITSRENAIIKETAKLLNEAAYRRERGLFVCEGIVMFREAVACGALIESVFISTAIDMPELEMPKDAQIYSVPPHVLEKISDVRTPQGIVFTCQIPPDRGVRGEKIIALENIADPGNVGTIIRTAEAFSIDTVVLVGACADLYSPKTIRATMGAVMRVNACFMTSDELFDAMSAASIPVYGAALSQTAETISDVCLDKAAVIIGNEARGIEQTTLDRCDKHVIIPINNIESLNAAIAASIFMYEMSKAK